MNKYLPIGTIVTIKDNPKKVMITSYLVFSKKMDKDTKIFDYGACGFPEGVIDSDFSLAFNHEQIDKVVHLGYSDDEQKEFNEKLTKAYNQLLNELGEK